MPAGDTIFALAAGGTNSALSVMRITGPRSTECVEQLAGRCPPAREAKLLRLRNSAGELLDKALVLSFPGPRSYTGEDSAELYLHGGRAVFEDVAAALVECGARPAEPGEFTRRAFLNGRMDLLEAEAVADLVEAETTAQRHQALQQLEGVPGRVYDGWAERLLALLAQEEALIDFPDEDLPAELAEAAAAESDRLRFEISSHLNDGHRGERLRAGLVFAVTGPPNVGKSSLVNALAEREVAIVAATPGTTRDVLETVLVFRGVKVTLLDTAGLRDAADPVEAEGIRRAQSRAASSDLRIEVVDASNEQTAIDTQSGSVVVWNKIDLKPAPFGALGVSVATGAGIPDLQAKLAAEASRLTESQGAAPLTRSRHRAALVEALRCLDSAALATAPELRGEDLRRAVWAIGTITGRIGAETVLDSIFRQFCIGK